MERQGASGAPCHSRVLAALRHGGLVMPLVMGCLMWLEAHRHFCLVPYETDLVASVACGPHLERSPWAHFVAARIRRPRRCCGSGLRGGVGRRGARWEHAAEPPRQACGRRRAPLHMCPLSPLFVEDVLGVRSGYVVWDRRPIARMLKGGNSVVIRRLQRLHWRAVSYCALVESLN